MHLCHKKLRTSYRLTQHSTVCPSIMALKNRYYSMYIYNVYNVYCKAEVESLSFVRVFLSRHMMAIMTQDLLTWKHVTVFWRLPLLSKSCHLSHCVQSLFTVCCLATCGFLLCSACFLPKWRICSDARRCQEAFQTAVLFQKLLISMLFKAKSWIQGATCFNYLSFLTAPQWQWGNRCVWHVFVCGPCVSVSVCACARTHLCERLRGSSTHLAN